MYQGPDSVLLHFGYGSQARTGESSGAGDLRLVVGRDSGRAASEPDPWRMSPRMPGDILHIRQRDEFAVRPRTIPTNASTDGVVRAAGQASATVDAGPSLSTRWPASLRW